MRQRKVRTLLTTIGVAVGSFVLITSLAIGEGVQQVLLGQLRKQDQLRRILVWPGSGPPSKGTAEELEVPGDMSGARRARLREAIERRRQTPTRKPVKPGLSDGQLAEMAALPHVEAVTPAFAWSGA